MRRRASAFLAFLTLAGTLAFGGTTGKIAGEVVNNKGEEPIPGASVRIEGTRLGAASDAEGAFTVLNVPPGVYTVRVSCVGFTPTMLREVKVVVDQTTTMRVEMNETSVEVGEMVVVAERPLVRKDATGTSSVVSGDDIRTLPGVRNISEIVALQAGVVASGSTIHIRGGRGNEVAYLVDGIYVEDPLFGELGTAIHKDAIEELQLLTGTFSAEYGDAMSGVVNIVTREGGEAFRAKLEARTSEFARPFLDYREGRVVGSVSGPVPGAPGLSFYVTGEQDYRSSWLPFGYNRDISTMGKLSHRISEDHKITASYRYTDGARQNYNHDYKYVSDQYYHSRTSSNQGMGNLRSVLSTNAFVDLKVSYLDQQYQLGLLGPDGKFLDTSQFIPTGQRLYKPDAGTGYEFYALSNPEGYTKSRTKTLNIKADAEWQLTAKHEIKGGLEFKRHALQLFDVYGPKRSAPYVSNYERTPVEGALYIKDKMEFASLVIDVGLRYDYADQRSTFRDDPLRSTSTIDTKPRSQLSPRIGIAHPISDRTNLHFSYGHFFQNPEYQYLFENSQYDLNVREPIFGQPTLDAQRTVAYEVGVSQQVSDFMALNVTAYYKDVTGLVGTHYYPPFVGGRYVGYTLYVNEDYANMKGFEVDITARRSRNLTGRLTYSYSSAKGSASSEGEQYPGTQESTMLYYLSFDKTHTINSSLSLAFGEQEGPALFDTRILSNTYWNFTMRASSGFPYTPSGRDVGFVIRNSARMPWTYTIDAEVGKTWRAFGVGLTAFVEVLNLTDHKNVVDIYTDSGRPDFTITGNHSKEWMDNPSNYGPPRRARLGFRLEL